MVIPTHGGRFLPEAVRSVQAQAFADWELVIVDDGSTDGTAEVAHTLASKDARIRVATNPRNLGIAAARNRGLASISPDSRFVAFLDHDDLWMPGALETLRGALLANPQASAAHGTATGIDQLGATAPYPRERTRRMGIVNGRLVEWPRERATEFANLAYENCIVSTGSALIQRKDLDALGGFDLRAAPADDHDLWI
ncbi:MAG TPA: glycosyltransferase family A protein, partial [Polyangia bacterium]